MVVRNLPLPKNPYHPPEPKEWHDAYVQCLQIYHPDIEDMGVPAIYARLLGHLMLEAPTPEGRHYISQEILRCGGDLNQLHQLAEIFVHKVLPICEPLGFDLRGGIDLNLVLVLNQCSTPPAFDESSKEDYQSFFSSPVEESPQDHISAKRAVSLEITRVDNRRVSLFNASWH